MPEIKRLNYFTSQFLVEQDFQDEQAYHRQMRYRHNRLLHTWGVIEGLEVTRSGDRQVSVSPGTASDRQGQEIVLTAATTPTPSSNNTFRPNATVYVTIAYNEASDPGDRYQGGGVDNFTRTTERPILEISDTVPPRDGSVIILAEIVLDANGNINTINSSVQQLASAVIAPAAIGTTQLADGIVTTAKLNDNAVTRAKIGDGAVGNTQLGNNAVNSAKIEDNAITTAKIADNAVNAAKIQLLIPQQNRPTRRYYAPLFPTLSTQLSGPDPGYLYAPGTGLLLRQLGRTVLWLNLPHGSLMTNFGAVVREPGNTTFSLQLTLAQLNKDHISNTLQILSFTSTSERASILSQEVNNEFFYVVFVNYQQASTNVAIIQSVYIDYQPTQLF
ncbi:hypothetical protein WA1_00275 [Scytonema hofmannii PCC 7110]|uniref:Uncharacterized protein n=1 Tax=Scytonema hofmannii PCC 7110 TaxID=128403 RepID=A0A139XG20_9CYAN|nr:hypothetical protein [Scytonema hofmannii]KYC43645.1 hypothetical protein WA1_00275 [Scytonema hofmannii PCC 7110]